MNCISEAWLEHEKELRSFIHSRVKQRHLAEDLLQDVFIKALAEGGQFCELKNARAWLFRAAKNRIIDYQRTAKNHDDVSGDIQAENEINPPVKNLSACLPIVLKKMHPEDADIIQCCDLEGVNQADYAAQKGLSLTAAKSRIQRARKRLKNELKKTCKIIFDEQGNVCCFGDDVPDEIKTKK